MSIHKQDKGKRGSLKWIQKLINERSEIIAPPIVRALGLDCGKCVEWRSPCGPQFTEYRDSDFLKAIGHSECEASLRQFWPPHGPQWDALGVVSDGTVVLVEAKAHIAEVFTTIKAKKPKSCAKIEASIQRTWADLGIESAYPWTAPFYQYANRVAHLHFLHNMCNIPTILVFVHFLGDEDMDGPRRRGEWKETNREIRKYLGLTGNAIEKRILDVFIKVSDLTNSASK